MKVDIRKIQTLIQKNQKSKNNKKNHHTTTTTGVKKAKRTSNHIVNEMESFCTDG
jgi:hypothetical protein